MSTPESKVKERVKKVLKFYGAYYHMPVQNGFGAPTLDFVCCYEGMYFAVEAKAPGKKPTPLQERTIQSIRDARGKVFVIDGETYVLEEWLELHKK